jgi:hypothetical protein
LPAFPHHNPLYYLMPPTASHSHHNLQFRQISTTSPFVSTNPPPLPSPTTIPKIRPQQQTNNTLIIVGVLAGLIGTLIFIFLVWKCCYDPAGPLSLESRARWEQRNDEEGNSEGDSYFSEDVGEEVGSGMRGGGSEKEPSRAATEVRSVGGSRTGSGRSQV